MRCSLVALLFAIVLTVGSTLGAEENVPAELTPFIGKDMQLNSMYSADLNADGLSDYALVVEPVLYEGDETDPMEIERTLLLIVRDASKRLTVAAHSSRAVYCAACGGMMGDPFQGLVVEKGKFTISHYGGSSWRWANDSTFAYSRRDKAWQLVRVEEVSFHAAEPDKEERTVFTPPKDFGKIDFKDFDPEHWKGVGPK